jgi:hypothetical protein
MDFSQALVNGIPLLFVIWGLVAFVKSFGVEGRTLTTISLALGLVLGILYQLSTNGVPTAFDGWFGVVIYGLGLGIVASGLYDVVKRDLLPNIGTPDTWNIVDDTE